MSTNFKPFKSDEYGPYGGRYYHQHRVNRILARSGQSGPIRPTRFTLFRLFWFLFTVALAAKCSQQQSHSSSLNGPSETEFLAESNIVNQENIELEVSKVALECHLRPVVHILQHPGCVPKPIPSFACFGTCSSYVQVSSSKFWQLERSCNCCQEIGEREAAVSLFCPKQTPKFRKVTTRAPVECMCRPCTAVDRDLIKAQEMLDISSEQTPN